MRSTGDKQKSGPVWVCSKIEPARRRPTLSYSFHRELAALPVEEQERWLTVGASAVDPAWSVAKLKEEMKAEKERLAQYPNNGSPNGADSTWNPPAPGDEPAPRTNGVDRSNQSRAEVIRACIEAIRAIAPKMADGEVGLDDLTAIDERIVSIAGGLGRGPALSQTDYALALKPTGWRIGMEETSGGWAVRLRKDGAQFSLATGPHLPSAIIEACLGAVLSDESVT